MLSAAKLDAEVALGKPMDAEAKTALEDPASTNERKQSTNVTRKQQHNGNTNTTMKNGIRDDG